MARRKINDPEDPTSPSFEQSLADLESIIEGMENGSLTLEELVAHYEKGSTLLNYCESVLQVARGRIELITLRNQKETTTQSVALPEDEPTEFSYGAADSESDDNDIRLF